MAVRARRFLSLFLIIAVALLGGAVTVTAAPAVNYVALGDSYSSGLGAGAYGDSGGCKRSANAFPRLWAESHAVTSFAFVACSGARTSDVLNQAAALDAGTTLVTVSVGGNDAGFADVMIDCTFGTDQQCVAKVEQAKTYARETLPGLLDNVYATLITRAPGAEIVVLGYPRIYELGGSCKAGLSETKRTAINSGADTLAEVTAQRAWAAGLTFVDVRGPFTGHEICSSDWWLHSLTWPVEESYHPTAPGQSRGYLPALEAVVSGVPALEVSSH